MPCCDDGATQTSPLNPLLPQGEETYGSPFAQWEKGLGGDEAGNVAQPIPQGTRLTGIRMLLIGDHEKGGNADKSSLILFFVAV